MSLSTTSIAELPQTANNTQPIVQSMQNAQMIYEPEQKAPVSTQQISNEFYGNVSAQPQFPQNQNMTHNDELNYKPINLHPNPYGTQHNTPEGPPLPESSPQRNQQQPQGQQYTVDTMPQQTLPSRDIPMNTLEYQQDNEIKPNHIPSVKLTSDYIREYEKANEEELKQHRQQKYRQEAAHDTISDLQVPILITVLYFIFQMPIVSTLMRKYLSFANLYNEDGNFNITGLLFKSILFGSFYYSMQTTANKISSI